MHVGTSPSLSSGGVGWGDTSQLLRENLDLRPGPGPCAARQAGDEREDIPVRQPCGRAPRRGLPRLPCGTGVTAPQRKWGRDRVTRGSSGLPGDGTGVGLGPDEEPPRAAATSSCRSSSSRPRLRVRSWHPPIPPTAGPAGSQRQPPAGSVLPSQAAAVGRAPAGPAVGRAPVRGTPGPELQASLPCMSSATCTFHSRRAPGGPGLAERPQLEGLAALRVLQAAGAVGQAVSPELMSACLHSHPADETLAQSASSPALMGRCLSARLLLPGPPMQETGSQHQLGLPGDP